ncbi:hypothetical protein C1646_632422 [Rhizophagus diaphanus]|nr:hypothetical protein C1646_632422 [Rhizophagus diaphanus] [Rhizophagus sp. MUCL 43196]
MIGKFYEMGFGIEKNNSEAFKWYMEARNNSNGIFEAGNCYYYGYGVEKNRDKAFEFFKRASAKNGFIQSQYELANCYEVGIGTQKNEDKASKWVKKYKESIVGIFLYLKSYK